MFMDKIDTEGFDYDLELTLIKNQMADKQQNYVEEHADLRREE